MPKLGFLNGGGEMGERIRAHDWSSSPLGRPATWPVSLRSAVSICLNSAFPTAIYCGPDLLLLYNDAWAPIPAERHPRALGRPAIEVWADIWPVIGPQFERVLATGEGFSVYDQMLPMERGGRVQETYWNYSFTPIRDDDGEVVGILNQGNETTERVVASRRQDFKLKLEDALRNRTDARDIMAGAAEALGRHLGADRVGYGEVQPDDRTVVLDVCWADGVAALSGSYDLDSFGTEDIAGQRQGLPQSCDDVLEDPRQEPAVWTAIETRAYASVPLIRNGRFTASIYVNFREPHRWSAEEIALVEEVGARTWEAVERARAEDERRESEARFRNLADHTPMMMWVTDPTGACTYLNRSWYEFTGQTPRDALGFGWLDATHPDDRAAAERVFMEANDARRAFRLEYRLRRHDGAYRWSLDAGAPRFAPSGEFLGFVGSVIDIDERRSVETALRESEERLRLAAQAAHIGTWDLDLVRGHGHWDDAASRIGGLSSGHNAYDTTTWLRLVHPEDREKTSAAFLASLEPDGPAYDAEFRGAVPADDGGTRWLTSHGAVIRDPETGRSIRAVGIIRDATARHRQQERLRESEARLRTITNAVPAFVWFATPDGHLQYLNDRWFEYTGQTEAEALPDGWAGVLHPDDVALTAERWADARSRGVTYECECRYRRRDGAYRWYVARAEPLRDEADAITLWFGTSTDIHERKQAIERLELALDAGAIQGTWVWDVPTDRVTADERFAYTFGIDPEEARSGFPIERAVAAIHEEDRERVGEAIKAALAAGGDYRVEYRTRNSDGVFRWIEASGQVELAANGTPLRFAGVAVDVEERRQAEERMRLLAQEVDHRAKNLLGVVQSVVQLTRAGDVAAFKAAVSGRIQALARAHSLLADSRWGGVNINTLVREELAPFARTGVDRIRISGQALRLRPAASQALALAVHELATNGAKYGALSVERGTLDVSWRFTTAGGKRMLEFLWREAGGPSVTPPSREGFGSTVMRTSVERQLNGEIALDWAPEGLRCRIVVPADQLGAVRDEAPVPGPPPASPAGDADVSLVGRRVLILEDEALISLEIEQAVAMLGCEIVGPAGSADAAMDLIRTSPPDLAILDVNLGGHRSDRVARALRALDIPFVYCTGYAEPSVHVEPGLDAEIINKPIGTDVLAGAFRRLLQPPAAESMEGGNRSSDSGRMRRPA